MEKKYYEIIDEQLDRLHKFYNDNSPYDESKVYFINNKDFIKENCINGGELTSINNKLSKDGYVHFWKNSHNQPLITFDGLIFIQNGKYKSKLRNDRWKRWAIRSNVIFVAVATIVAGAYGGFEIWKYFYGYVPPPCPECKSYKSQQYLPKEQKGISNLQNKNNYPYSNEKVN